MHVHYHNPSTARAKRGFTLVEIAVVVLIIGLIAALALPTVLAAGSKARSATFINDLRQARSALEAYVMINGNYPADEGPGTIPAGLDDELKTINWTDPSPIGGQWDWDYGVFGITAAVSVEGPTESIAAMTKIDEKIDDGDLSTGLFRQRAGGYMFVIEQ